MGSNPILSAIFSSIMKFYLLTVLCLHFVAWLRMLPVLLPVSISRITRYAENRPQAETPAQWPLETPHHRAFRPS